MTSNPETFPAQSSGGWREKLPPLPPHGTILLSPHSDDIVMAAYHIIMERVLPGPLYLVTAFSRSRSMRIEKRRLLDKHILPKLLSGSRNSLNLKRTILRNLRNPETVTQIRLEEDARFCKLIQATPVAIDLPDCELRRGGMITDPSWDLEKESATIARLRDEVAGILDRWLANLLICPWPYGENQHLDHRLVLEAASDLAASKKTTLLFLDDLPYSRRPVESVFFEKRRNVLYKSILLPLGSPSIRAKHKAMEIYKSQMKEYFHKFVDLPPPGDHSRCPSETLWVPA